MIMLRRHSTNSDGLINLQKQQEIKTGYIISSKQNIFQPWKVLFVRATIKTEGADRLFQSARASAHYTCATKNKPYPLFLSSHKKAKCFAACISSGHAHLSVWNWRRGYAGIRPGCLKERQHSRTALPPPANITGLSFFSASYFRSGFTKCLWL